ncbi:MAG: M23 family metallopeptidase [Bacteroidales bacterium]|nr:M23 family metallopeptidase [Bacteroidales bacterium]
MKRILCISAIVVLSVGVLHSQKSKFPQNYFISPIDRALQASGTFGEFRSNHFHSGLDLRVGGVVGDPVYAVGDGYVSRIKVSGYGGGKIVYITHPNGYKSVYMHLNNFCGKIADWVEKYQYTNHTFDLDVDISPETLPVRSGDQIANAGNTGGSGGPHLHFELRYANNDKTINPLLFGYYMKDNTAPTIHDIRIYPFGESTTINGKNEPLSLYAQTSSPTPKKGKGKKPAPKPRPVSDTVKISGKFYLGIQTSDASDGSTGCNGVYRVLLTADDKLVYSYQDTAFMFEETRAINAMIDYPLYINKRTPYLLSRVLKGHNAGLCKAHSDGGYIYFTDNDVHTITYTVTDFADNVTTKTFYVQSVEQKPATPAKQKALARYIPLAYYLKNTHQKGDFGFEMDEYTIYENDYLDFTTASPGNSKLLSTIYTLRLVNTDLPPHKTYQLKIRIPDRYRTMKDKLLIVSTWGRQMFAQQSRVEKGFVVADVRTFGSFAIAMDTTAPTATPSNFSNTKPLKGNELIIKVSDNLSGVAYYHCYVNGNWTLAEFDGKTSSLTVAADKLNAGTNNVRLIIGDTKKNENTYEWTVKR